MAKAARNDKDIDPLALQVLKVATDPIRQSQSYSFRALVSRDQLGSNGQIVTLFHLSDVTVQRPDKLHLTFQGRGKKVEFFYSAGRRCSIPRKKSFTLKSRVLDWDLNATPSPDSFTFKKLEDAKEIELMKDFAKQ